MRGWHLRARVGRGAPWLIALMIVCLLAELALAVVHVGIYAWYLDRDFAASANVGGMTAGVIGIGIAWAAVMALTVVSTFARDKAVVNASVLGLAATFAIPILTWVTAGALGDAPIDEVEYPYETVGLVVPVLGLQVAVPGISLGFIVALVRAAVARSNRGYESAILEGSRVRWSHELPAPPLRASETFYPQGP